MTFAAAFTRLAGTLGLALWAVGCLPQIGDPCSSSLDCSQRGERLCDTTQLGGYCTVFNCEPDSCPDSTTCVAFNNKIDPACGTKNDGSWHRFERTFCVKPCSDDGDCREGYACIAVAEQGGLVIDTENPRELVCLLAVSLPPSDSGSSPGVCDPGDPDDLPPPYVPEPSSGPGGGGSGGAGGSGASGGAGGSGAAGGAGGSGASGGAGGSGAAGGAGGSGGAGTGGSGGG